ncbi:MAG TPA: acyl-CoA dehydratase activase [Dehalococcoidales bacterium]|nr:acyl-CoA dehydratase activase [Dehalococcoidales bacterium]
MKYNLGLDIGSINVKLALLDDTGKAIKLGFRKITSQPKAAINSLLSDIDNQIGLGKISSVGITGSGKAVIPRSYLWPEYSSSLAIASGLLHSYPDARTIIQIGGQSSQVIELEDGLKKPWKTVSNPLCAAGTGRFLEQQCYRLGIKIDEFGDIASKFQGSVPRIAARCSVFAKSDLIHLQQKGVTVDAMLCALSESIARMVVALKKGPFALPVYLVGGVAANQAIVKALSAMLTERCGCAVSVIVPKDHLYVEAIGAALLAGKHPAEVKLLPPEDEGKQYFETPGLIKVNLPGNMVKTRIEPGVIGYLGVDVGSTSTKAVILDESGKQILAKNYLMTAGRPVDAVKQVMANLVSEGADKIRIAGSGVTGSGRYLIGSLIGADIIKNEITAQTRAAAEIDPDADIIEIGGQDSKLVIKRNGVVVDYQMNKACAAGTGSFIDEMAEMLGVSVKNGEFAELALRSDYTIDLGTRCAAFMGQAVPAAQREGISIETISASLANSIAKNYLSKVVGTRKMGNKIILTGAVFYNQAVVAAFHQQMPGKNLRVAEQREVSGAIGAALLAREDMVSGNPSKFKGFQRVIDAECNLSTFICKTCDNNCSITQMRVPGEKPTFYGSRCDKYDSSSSAARKETAFDEREKLLLKEYSAAKGTGLKVGLPRALFMFDFAPLLAGFLNSLGVEVVLSNRTNKEIVERSVELAYTDSCFPIKLLHGHVAALKETDYILFPSTIRMGIKEGEENQKYACPLVQASPYIVRSVLGLDEKILIPTFDFSRGDDEVIKNLTEVGKKLGFGADASKKAAETGLRIQKEFETERAEAGRQLLKYLQDSGKLGVVIISRAYMFQDAGANLGIAEKLAQLDVIPVPLDYLPLSTVDIRKYSDRPYWAYESRMLAAADIISRNPQLYGLILTNFGCGPNSFIINEIEDIIGGKPLGQLEIDEHAAEAGLVTRLEAFVDTIKGYTKSGKIAPPVKIESIYRGTGSKVNQGKSLIIPHMAPHAHVVAAAMQANGVDAIALPVPDERNLLYSNEFTSGTECLPYRVTLGDFLRFYKENGHNQHDVEGFMSGSFGPCRLGKYASEQIRILRQQGYGLPIITSVSNHAYRDLGLGAGFERLAWKSIVSTDSLQRLLWRTRPYEKQHGEADRLFEAYLKKVAGLVRTKSDLRPVLRQAAAEFEGLMDKSLPRRPLVGINGEIYLRSNDFSNNHLVRDCEKAGLEVVVSPMGEWFNYIAHRNLEDGVRDRKVKKVIKSYIKKLVQASDESSLARQIKRVIPEKEPTTAQLLAHSGHFLSSRCGSEAVLSIGSGIDWLENTEYAGVISVMPHGCMPGGIVAAMADRFSAKYQKPWINLTYDGFLETNNAVRINEFAELVRFCRRSE